jgi:hypothetical protein
MFSRIRRWLRRRQPSDRHIFPYHDGTRDRFADPIVAFAAIETTCPNWAEMLSAIHTDTSGIPSGPVRESLAAGQKDARAKLLEATRAALGVVPLSDTAGKPSGLTEGETVALFHRFLAWMVDAAAVAAPFGGWRNADAASRPDSPTASSPVSGSTGA